MKRKHFFKILFLGLLIWIVPFVTGFFFFDSSGKLSIDEALFKSLMIVVSSIIGGYSITRLYRQPVVMPVALAWQAGFVWLVMNWVLDVIVLIPMSGMNFSQYMYSIGIRYLQIPIFTIVAGYVVVNRTENSKT